MPYSLVQLDGMTAIKWAWILTQIGSEKAIVGTETLNPKPNYPTSAGNTRVGQPMQATVNIYGKQQPARGRESTYTGQWCTDDGSFCLLCHVNNARLRSHQLDAVVDYWDAASHRLASEMRLGRTFDEVSRAIIDDNLALEPQSPKP